MMGADMAKQKHVQSDEQQNFNPRASIQILNSTETSTTVAFVDQLRKELQPYNIETSLCSDTRGIKIDTPLVLLVQNYTRIGTDIDAAISCLKNTKIPPKLIAIIVIHAKEQHALPKVSSKIRLNDERYDDYGLLADFGFCKGNIYDCSLKCKGVGSIISYIKEKVTYTPTPSKGSEDHFHTEDPAISPNMPLKKVRSSNSKRVQMLTTKFTDATVKFKKYLEKELQTDIDYCVKEDEYQHGVPIILPVQKMTYVEQDIVCALSELKDIPRQDVAVAVIHINKQHALEKGYTKIKLPNEDCDKLGLVVDFACNNNYVYDHQMNTDSLKQLSDFIQVYLPCSNHSVASYSECLDHLSDLVHTYSTKGTVVILGDMNANLKSNIKENCDYRARSLVEFNEVHNLESVCLLKSCMGANTTFLSYNRKHESLIDHILVPYEILDCIQHSEIIDNSPLNLSNHRPDTCCLNVPIFINSFLRSEPRLKWEKANQVVLQKYEQAIVNDRSVTALLDYRLENSNDIDHYYDCLSTCILSAADRTISKSQFKSHLKPYWTDELSVCKNEANRTHKIWVDAGKPRSGCSDVFKNYKKSKTTFRKIHRRAVNDHLFSLNREIDETAELDIMLFWKLINSRKLNTNKGSSMQILFDGVMVRDAGLIAAAWGKYFEHLYTPDTCGSYDETFYNTIMSRVTELNQQLFSKRSTSSLIIDEILISDILNKCKRRKAPGADRVTYEHLLFGGITVRKLLVKFTAMLALSYTPSTMKRGIIITLFKGGKKPRSDPNSYRAITLSSVFLRLYESILLREIECKNLICTNKLQGGFQKGIGCLATSFAVKESINYCLENKSKLYVCFLDAKQAFDRVWHEGLFYKLFDTGIDESIYKAFISIYSENESCVRYKGHYSDWFPILRGTRQGGVSSPKLYLLYINGLIEDLVNSGLGFCIFDTSFACPTVADDMCLISFSKGGLDKMLDICYSYSCRWRYLYNPQKCAVIVFNESTSGHSTRRWVLGGKEIEEQDSYMHLGIYLNRLNNYSPSINDAKNKHKSTFFSLVGSGLHEHGLNPLTSYRVYKATVIPKALYGCELWSNLSKDNILALERAHLASLKCIQGLPKRTRSLITLSLIGARSLESEINYKKLLFFGFLCNLNYEFLTKKIFLNRLTSYTSNPHLKQGFIPDISKLLSKYKLVHISDTFLVTGSFPSKFSWKRILRNSIDDFEKANRLSKMFEEETFLPYIDICTTLLNPVPPWLLSQQDPNFLTGCICAVKILGFLYCRDFSQTCYKCTFSTYNLGEHLVFECQKNEVARNKLWYDIYGLLGVNGFISFTGMNRKTQITNLCFGLFNLINDDLTREICLKIACSFMKSIM